MDELAVAVVLGSWHHAVIMARVVYRPLPKEKV